MTTVHHVVIGSENSMVAVNGKPAQWTDSFTRRYNHVDATLKFARTLADALGVDVIRIEIGEPKQRKNWTYAQVMSALMADEQEQPIPDKLAIES